jgi:transposase
MMGRAGPPQGKLFYDGFRLEERVRPDHPLRTIHKLVDFDFAYREVKDCYGYNGNVSVPPPVILKLMFLLFYYDVVSERELLDTLPERLDWLWFLDYDLDDSIPDHSILSKARARWGVEVFRRLFTRMVEQCVALGLVAGRKVYGDSSLVDANAANDSIKKTGRFLAIYGEMEKRLSVEEAPAETESQPERPYVSTTDPDAAVVPGKGGARARLEDAPAGG